MASKPEPAVLLIADISGYTGYLAGVELDHAQDILADVIDTIVGALRPPFHLSKLEGDAAFVHLVSPDIDGLHLQNVIEAAYYAFRRRQRNIVQTSICECDACRHIPDLDLKFVVHYGQVARQVMSGQDELVGRDVILVHRLLKNDVAAHFGKRPYVLYTDAFVKAAGIDPAAQRLVAHRETVDIIGEVAAWLTDLEAAWLAEENQKRERVTAENAMLTYVFDIAAPRQTVWEYATAPRLKPLWFVGTERVDEDTTEGRRGQGTVNHCIHGEEAVLEEILDWRPPDYVTRLYRLPVPGAPLLITTMDLTELPNGRTLYEAHGTLQNPDEIDAFAPIRPVLESQLEQSNAKFIAVVEAAAAAEASVERAEPGLPVSAGRFLSEPMTAKANAER